jgi:hypothetical protein
VLRSNESYADIGITAIMPNAGLCRANLDLRANRAQTGVAMRHNQSGLIRTKTSAECERSMIAVWIRDSCPRHCAAGSLEGEAGLELVWGRSDR